MTMGLIKAGFTALAVLLTMGTAEADQIRTRTVKSPPRHQWTGFYVGGNVGYGVAGLTDNAPLAVTTNMTGVIGGVQAGYNYQIDSVVLGVEADIQASGQNASYTRNLPIVGDLTVNQRIPYFGTIRARAGYAFQCGCVMAYGTIGWAYGAYQPSVTAFGITLSGDYTLCLGRRRRRRMDGGAELERQAGNALPRHRRYRQRDVISCHRTSAYARA